jgi:rhodanese-related sulfurtransferase
MIAHSWIRVRPALIYWALFTATGLVLTTTSFCDRSTPRARSLVQAAALPCGAGESNLSVLTLGESVLHRVIVDNAGPTPWAITNVTASCECVRILSYPRQVAPVGTGEIAVEVAAERVGQFRYEIDVETSDSAAPRKCFSLTVAVVPWTVAELSTSMNVAPRIPWPTRVVEVRDQSLYLRVEDVLAPLAKATDLTFVDVRDKRAYQAEHIPGVVNLAPHAVKSAGFLRGRMVVLVDEGWGNPALETECRRLTKMGFAARILRGGMNAWQTAGGSFEPACAANPVLAEVQPRDYLAARRFDDWLVVDARSKSEAAESPILEAVNIPFSSAPEFSQSVARLVARRGAFTRLLVVDADGKEDPRIGRALPLVPGCVVFFLAGGHQALRDQVAMGMALAQSRTERTGGLAGPRGGPVIKKPCVRCP